MNISKILSVARWEFVEKARTKAYIISIVLTPLLPIVFGFIAGIAARGDNNVKRFAVYDETMSFVAPAQARLNETDKLKNGSPAFDLVPVNPQSMNEQQFTESYAKRVFDEEFKGLVIIRKNLEATHEIEYRGENVGNIQDIRRIERVIEGILSEQLATKNGINPETYKAISKSIDTKTIKISRSGESKNSGFLETFAVVYGSMLLMFMLIMFTGQMLVRGLMEEKSNRIMEILVSSCSPFELMMGKLVGLSGLGLVQAVAWGGMAIGAMVYFKMPLGSIAANLPTALLFTVLGYVLYASLLLGLGSLTTTEQEAQQITGYAVMALVLPLVTISSIIQNPNSMMAKVMSFVPFTAPSAMVARMAILTPPWWEITLSLGLLVAAIIIVTYLAAKIFRVAILVYGKRPTLPEIISFLKD